MLRQERPVSRSQQARAVVNVSRFEGHDRVSYSGSSSFFDSLTAAGRSSVVQHHAKATGEVRAGDRALV